jgi:hypothetical protein
MRRGADMNPILRFAAGFVGPMRLAPGANQGPMLGIFITGPLGHLVGAGLGLWYAWRPEG